MSDIFEKVDTIFEGVEDFNGSDPFLAKINEYQLEGIEFAEIQPFKKYGICTNKNDNQHESDPLIYYSVVMDEKDKVRYFKLNHRNADHTDNNAIEITEEDFLHAVRPSTASSELDIRTDELTKENQLTDDLTIKNVDEK